MKKEVGTSKKSLDLELLIALFCNKHFNKNLSIKLHCTNW